jgi:hypothetical protein
MIHFLFSRPIQYRTTGTLLSKTYAFYMDNDESQDPYILTVIKQCCGAGDEEPLLPPGSRAEITNCGRLRLLAIYYRLEEILFYKKFMVAEESL